jgi:2-cysteine adaptor domain
MSREAFVCSAWLADPSINPVTGRRISALVKKGPYATLKRKCLQQRDQDSLTHGDDDNDKKVTKKNLRSKKANNQKTNDDDDDAEAADKYCRCLMRVRPKLAPGETPYAICYSSVMTKRPRAKRPKTCSYDDLSEFSTKELLAYAKELSARKKTVLKLRAEDARTKDDVINYIKTAKAQ